MCPSLTRTFSLPQARNFSDILGWEGRCGRTAGAEFNVWAFNLSFSENSDQFTSRSFWGPNFNWEENSDIRENSSYKVFPTQIECLNGGSDNTDNTVLRPASKSAKGARCSAALCLPTSCESGQPHLELSCEKRDNCAICSHLALPMSIFRDAASQTVCSLRLHTPVCMTLC